MAPKRKSRRYICEAKHIQKNAESRKVSDSSSDEIPPNNFFINDLNNSCLVEDSSSSDFNTRLAQWFSANNVSTRPSNELLKLLSEKISGLPQDVRSLKCTPRGIIKRVVMPGSYVHYGVKDALTDFFSNFCYESNSLSLNFNVDGLPLFKSSREQTWPILFNINGTKPILVAGLYVGNSKPNDPNDYLEELVSELLDLIRDGIVYQDRKLNISVRAFICDAPARAFILGVKHHSGFYSCNQCTQKGKSFQRRIIFEQSDSLPRSNSSFRNRLQPEHHNIQDKLVLESLPIDMVSQFALDYMHIACLGIMKTLLVALVRVRGHRFSLNRPSITTINTKLISFRNYMPREFNRKPRSLDELERYKATEFRTFILYTGPIVFKNILDSDRYNHFLLFSLGMRLLLHSEYCITKNQLASSLLNNFVEQVPSLYSFSMLTFNFHCLTHLSKQSIQFGSLETISSFPFENFLGQLKKMVKKSGSVIEQLYNRIVERSILKVVANERTLNLMNATNKIVYNGLFFDLKESNSFYFIKNNNIYKIFQICAIENNSLYSRLIVNLEPFFLFPVDSTLVGIFSSTNFDLESTVLQHSIESISGKIIHIFDTNMHIYFPFVN